MSQDANNTNATNFQLDPLTIAQLTGRTFAQPTPQQLKTQGAMKAGAGLVDVIQGKIGQRRAEQDIEQFGAEQDELIQQYKDMSAPSLMDPNTVAAATRNAAILGGVPAQPDASSELAAAKMAMESGADPATIQRNLAQAQQMESAQAAGQANQAFQQGLGFAQQDAQNQFAKQQENMMMDIDNVSAALEAAQRESLMGQQLAQRGSSNIMSGGTQLFQGIKGQKAIDAKAAAAAEAAARAGRAMDDMYSVPPSAVPQGIDSVGGEGGLLSYLSGFGSTTGDPSLDASSEVDHNIQLPEGMTALDYLDEMDSRFRPQSQERGGLVQKTPGEFDHDTNDMILMAPTERGLVDTGIRQTGGEFVLNPEQAEGLEEAYENVNRKKPTYDQLLALYEAARFLDEPQFDDDYVA